MAIRQLSVFLENRPGKLASVTRVLAAEKINLRAMSLAEAPDFGIVRLIPENIDKAEKILKERGFLVKQNHVVAAVIDDKPGALDYAVNLLAENGMNMEYMYAFLSPSKDHACMVIRVDNNAEAEEILNKNGITLINEAQLGI
ncbi:MAG: ACT domain-containing protein [Clostridia bacterium]|nr:ACT domain-containing protein [Clostridia bacterium]